MVTLFAVRGITELNGKLYVSQGSKGVGSIGVMNLDGTGQAVFAKDVVFNAKNMAANPLTNRVAVIDSTGQSIVEIDADKPTLTYRYAPQFNHQGNIQSVGYSTRPQHPGAVEPGRADAASQAVN